MKRCEGRGGEVYASRAVWGKCGGGRGRRRELEVVPYGSKAWRAQWRSESVQYVNSRYKLTVSH